MKSINFPQVKEYKSIALDLERYNQHGHSVKASLIVANFYFTQLQINNCENNQSPVNWGKHMQIFPLIIKNKTKTFEHKHKSWKNLAPL
uniref:Uncharacterized protein n=1 Tax=Panagrolaimus sp. JU765 TaxID=591449 RepID=A0AC34PV36_9BILA